MFVRCYNAVEELSSAWASNESWDAVLTRLRDRSHNFIIRGDCYSTYFLPSKIPDWKLLEYPIKRELDYNESS